MFFSEPLQSSTTVQEETSKRALGEANLLTADSTDQRKVSLSHSRKSTDACDEEFSNELSGINTF